MRPKKFTYFKHLYKNAHVGGFKKKNDVQVHVLFVFGQNLKMVKSALFSLRLRQLQNMIFNASTASSGDENR